MSDPSSALDPKADPSLPPNEEWLAVGKVIGTYGLKGEVKVFPDSDFPERFTKPGLRWLRFPTQPSQIKEVSLIKGRFVNQKGIYVVKLADISYRDQAEALQGAEFLVRRCDRPTLAEGEYYLSDLIGLEVLYHQSKQRVGTVVKIASAGNDLLEIQLFSSTTQTVLIPFVPALVPIVDIENRRIEIAPPKGLLPDSSEPSQRKKPLS